jgi:hypothetical protein
MYDRNPDFMRVKTTVWVSGVLGLLVWGVVGWWLTPVFTALATSGVAGVAVLVWVGFAAGWTMRVQSVLGSSVPLMLRGAGWGVVLWWVLPMAVGALARGVVLKRELMRLILSDLWERQLAGLFRQPSDAAPLRVSSPPQAGDWIWRALLLTVAAVPLVGAVIVAVRGVTSNGVLLLAGGMLVFGSVLLEDHIVSVRPRHLRRMNRRGETLFRGFALLLAAGPVGVWITDNWRGQQFAYSNAVWLTLVGAALVLLVGTLANPMVRVKVWFALLLPVNLVLRNEFLFCATGLFHPDLQLLKGAVVLAAVYVLNDIWLAVRIRSPLTALRRLDASTLAEVVPQWEHPLLRAWVYDACLRRPSRPDLRVLHTLAAEATWTLQGMARPAYGDRAMALPDLGEDALRWVEKAEQLRAHLETDMVPALCGPRRDALVRALGLVAAHCAAAQASVYHFLAMREESVAAYQDAAAQWESLGCGVLAAGARIDSAQLLLSILGQPAAALVAVEPLLEVADLPGLERQRACALAAAACYLIGERTRADTLRRRAECTPSTVRDLVRLARAHRAAGLPYRILDKRDRNAALLGSVHRLAAQVGPGSIDATEARLDLPLTAWPDSKARRMIRLVARWHRWGQRPTDRTSLEIMARFLEQYHLLLEAYEIRLRLGTALWTDDPSGAYVNLQRAIELQEQARALILDAELRVNVGGSVSWVYERLIRLLTVDGKEKTSARAAWPKRPIQEAFELMERSRSRVFLELLGADLALSTPGTEQLQQLAAHERAAYEAYRHERDRLAATPHVVALRGLRAARDVLEATWTKIAREGPAGAEYAQLRRGEPVKLAEVRLLLTHGTSSTV